MPAVRQNKRIYHRTSPSPSPQPVHRSDSTLASLPPPNEGNMQPERRTKLTTEPLVTQRGRSKGYRPKNSTLGRILQLAQFIKRGVDLWVNVQQAINVGRAVELLEEYEALGERDDNYDEEEKEKAERIVETCSQDREALVKAYKGIRALLSEHTAFIDDLDDEDDREFWRRVNSAAEQGRNNDTAGLKAHAHRYVLKDGQLTPSINGQRNKTNRGIHHPQLMRVIVPMSVLHKYGNNDNFEDLVRAKSFKITHKSAPAFLYDLDMWDPNILDKGLLRGLLPVRILRHIFTSPSSVTADPGKKGRATRQCNASILGLKEITPEMIVYACVQARFYISSLEVFGEVDEDFNFKSFYYGIIKLLTDGNTTWVKETLAWWNEQVFGSSEDKDDSDDDDDDDETSFANILAAQKTREAQELPPPPVDSQTQADSQYDQHAFNIQA